MGDRFYKKYKCVISFFLFDLQEWSYAQSPNQSCNSCWLFSLGHPRGIFSSSLATMLVLTDKSVVITSNFSRWVQLSWKAYISQSLLIMWSVDNVGWTSCVLTWRGRKDSSRLLSNGAYTHHTLQDRFNFSLLHCWWECKLVQPLWRTVWRFLKKTKIRATIWSSNPIPAYISGENHNLKRFMYPNVHCSTILQQPRHGSNLNGHWWVDREDVVYIYNGILCSHKMNEIMPFATIWMDLEIVILKEVSQTQKDKYPMISLTCGI